MTATPRSIPAATRLLERYAELDGQLATVEGWRAQAIAQANASADTEAAPLLKELAGIRAAIEPWWSANAAALTDGKRKSIELGGCMIGSRTSRPTLTIAGDEKDVVAVLNGLRWAKPLLRVKVTLDRAAILKSLDGSRSAALAELGIGRSEPEEQFYVERAEQAGTLKS